MQRAVRKAPLAQRRRLHTGALQSLSIAPPSDKEELFVRAPQSKSLSPFDKGSEFQGGAKRLDKLLHFGERRPDSKKKQ